MPKGGKRENAGRKKMIESEKSKRCSYYLRENEKKLMDDFFETLKSKRTNTKQRDLKNCTTCEHCGKETILPTKYNKYLNKWVCSTCLNLSL